MRRLQPARVSKHKARPINVNSQMNIVQQLREVLKSRHQLVALRRGYGTQQLISLGCDDISIQLRLQREVSRVDSMADELERFKSEWNN